VKQKFHVAICTPEGIYTGIVEGYVQPDETVEHAAFEAIDLIKSTYTAVGFNLEDLSSSFCSTTEIFVKAPVLSINPIPVTITFE
jgi:hypothetical protein